MQLHQAAPKSEPFRIISCSNKDQRAWSINFTGYLYQHTTWEPGLHCRMQGALNKKLETQNTFVNIFSLSL